MIKNKIIEQLNKNRAKNISLLGIIENYGIESSLKYKDSYLITIKTDHLWCYPAVESKNELVELLKRLEGRTNYFAALENWMIPVVSQNGKFEWELKTERLILPDEAKLDFSIQKKIKSSSKNLEAEKEIKIRELKNKDADFIFAHSHYQDFTSKAYIKERIAADCSAGIFINEELAAWGLTHDDGAVGFIHVREDFRKNGYAHLIMEKLIKNKRENGKDVFLNVEPDNSKAKKLFYSLGFEFDRIISWIKLKEE
ncbi:FR47-like protein [Halanaerobium saccharolyticum]|uniref:FR47-like protein n=1 Tax=Halanaerobium saccharolyticum TaxID=43595 RepID=A0A4R7YRE5_9FIRM|nr:GNAT family N-acetyltransferase [Halanaerobium saccharolyticum]RAK05263.1 FR47-like protein [Halanaerobium saccharolyticum]TDV99628.1 FR47-like protein [Halanaerobium saccharolyticum]TDX51744.1 FR47-like protein [Halanaerobium saccharolyticum]